MLRRSSLAALMGTALLVAAAQPHGAAALSSGYVTYDVRTQNPDGSWAVTRQRLSRDQARRLGAIADALRDYEVGPVPPSRPPLDPDRPLPPGLDLLQEEGTWQVLDAVLRQQWQAWQRSFRQRESREAAAEAAISKWLDEMLESEPGGLLPLGLRLEPVGGTFPGSREHTGYRGGDSDDGGDDGGGDGGGH